MDEQDQAQQALMESFRRERTKLAEHPPRKLRWQRLRGALPWVVAVAVVLFIIGPVAFIVAYPRFGPDDTMTAFCMAEGAGEYNTAYALLSKHAQEQVSPDAFAQASQDANLSLCTAYRGVPILFGATRATFDVEFAYNGSGGQVDGTMTFVHEQNGWRVDSMDPDLLHLSS